MRFTVSCPRDCFCEPHSKNVHCTNKGLHYIPERIPRDTVELILNQNSFLNPDLSSRNFTNLKKLKKLFLSRCSIETVAADSFSTLIELEWLDISYNRITFLTDYTFRGLNSLKHLFINNNHDIHISMLVFYGMRTQGLYMNNCGLVNLPIEVLLPLNGSLKALWLHKNKFESFAEIWLNFFGTLAHIRLWKNPFHCNCELGWLHKFYMKNPSRFSNGERPSCSTPAFVRGKSFSNLTSDDFRCELPAFRNVDADFDQVRNTGKLTCQARGDPVPTISWIRPDGQSHIYHPSHENEETEMNEGILYMTNVNIVDRSRYKCVASNPAGNVTFSLNMVWPNRLHKSTVDEKFGPTTPKLFRPHLDSINVIMADVTLKDENQKFNDVASMQSRTGRKKESKQWVIDKIERKSGASWIMPGEQRGSMNADFEADRRFSLVDVVGATIGTFLLSVILTALLSQLYWRRKQCLRQRHEDHYSVPDLKPPLTHARLYIMDDCEAENRVRMLNHHNNLCNLSESNS